MSAKQDLTVRQGGTFSRVLRWEAPPYIYKPITGITKGAPAVVTCVGHALPPDWRVAIVSVKGMTGINAQNNPPKASDYLRATVRDVDTLELNTVNSSDFGAYTAGGFVMALTPVNLAGYTARMTVKNKVGGVVLASTESAHAPNNIITIVLDNTSKTITVTITAEDTAALTWKSGVYDLEFVSATGVVTPAMYGKVTVEQEITT